MSNPIGAVDAGLSVAQTQLGFQNMVNTADPVTQINEISQMAAGFTNLVNNPVVAAATNASAALVTLSKMALDAKDGKPLSVGDALSVAGNLVSVAAALAITLSPVGRAAGILAKAAIGIGVGQIFGGISAAAASEFTAASNWVERRDPLTLDLDADGLETVGINPTAPILFDHDGDGVKTGTGWVSPDDGFLVLDRNGNGTIDSGIELFGDSTPLSTGGNAADGFAALAAEDTNLDGKVSATDARFANLRIWRDLNQDGISQSSELATLASLNITSLNVAKTANSQLLANGNVIADLGTYTKTDGTLGTLGDTAQLGDINLTENTFISQFTDTIPISVAAAALPEMQGSGRVRDLREASEFVFHAGDRAGHLCRRPHPHRPGGPTRCLAQSLEQHQHPRDHHYRCLCRPRADDQLRRRHQRQRGLPGMAGQADHTGTL